ncbi:MAG TPA: hypothetical protein PLQ14_04870, partial [Actinomycetota bacterium]|nr:hypothetical protein [Actinomycetota bacterium]
MTDSRTSSPEAAKRSHRPLIIGGITVAVLGAGAVYAAGWTSLMGVNTITVQGATVTSSEQLIGAAGIEKGTPM